MTERLWKMAESRGAHGVDRFDRGTSAWSWHAEPISAVGGCAGTRGLG
jgi:hypothetical protein